MAASTNQGGTQANPYAMNQFARTAITKGVTIGSTRIGPAIKRTYLMPSGTGTYVPANTPQITLIPQNVGLLVGVWVQVIHTISNGASVPISLSDFGPLNALAQVQFNDLQNNTRIQCPGWGLGMVNSVRQASRSTQPFAASFTRSATDCPVNFGPNFAGVTSATPLIAPSGTGSVTMWYFVPVSYSEDDLRGTIYMNVLNATCQLILSFPGNGGSTNYGVTVAVVNGADSTQAMYVGTEAGSVNSVSISSTTVNAYQLFYDQLPVSPQNGQTILPQMDMQTIYEIKQTVQTAIVANQDFPYQYANFRDFLSTLIVYVNTASNGARGNGSDVNYFALQSANFTNIWKLPPAVLAVQTRNLIGSDMPPGCYYFPTRQRRISTNQYGNMQVIMNASTAGTGAYQLVLTEDFARQTSLSIAGSLSAS